ncbi:transposase [Bradyrhizobium sp. USDA 4516]
MASISAKTRTTSWVTTRGAIVLRQKWSRGQVEALLANMSHRLIGMEACVGAHDLSRKLESLSHDARLMPAKSVRPYSKGQKNYFNDTEAIAEAVQHPTMKFVATKTAEQLGITLGARATGVATHGINQICAFMLERGIAMRQGIGLLRTELLTILATRTWQSIGAGWISASMTYPKRSKLLPVKIKPVRA